LFKKQEIRYPGGCRERRETLRVLSGSAREIINWSFPDNQIFEIKGDLVKSKTNHGEHRAGTAVVPGREAAAGRN